MRPLFSIQISVCGDAPTGKALHTASNFALPCAARPRTAVQISVYLSGLHRTKASPSSALRAAFGGCAMYRPAGLVSGEVSAEQADGGVVKSKIFSPSVKNQRFLTAPSSEGAF